MKVFLEDAGPCRKVVHVSASADEIAEEYEKVVQAYVSIGKMPGFRKGKAPKATVERHYAKSIGEDVKDRVVPQLYRTALAEENINPVAIVGVGDVDLKKGVGVQFKVTIDVPPDFKLPKYKKIPLKQNREEITGSSVDDALRGLREQRARFEEVSGRNVMEGDLVMLDYKAEYEGKPLEELVSDAPALCSGTDFLVMVGEQEFLPGFREGLIGSAIGEDRDINVAFPADYRVPAVAGKDVAYAVNIKGFKAKVPGEIDDECLKQFGVDSKEALREKVQDELREAAEMRENRRLKNEIGKFLLSKTSFDLPQTVLEQEKSLAVQNMVQAIVREGGTREQIEKKQEMILNAAEQSSADKVRVSYILSRIADAENISVEDGEVDERLQQMAAGYRMPVKNLRSELEKRNGVEALKSDVRAGKTLDFLLKHCKLKK